MNQSAIRIRVDEVTTPMADIELQGDTNSEHQRTAAGSQGNVQLRDPVTNQLNLIPHPSGDPKDPLNWYGNIPIPSWVNLSYAPAPTRPRGFRIFIAVIASSAALCAQFLSAGPSVDMIQMIFDLFRVTPSMPAYPSAIAKASYFFTGVAFLHGMSSLFYMPLIVKYGRRPVYVGSFLLYGGCSLWAGLATSYSSELAARLMLGFAGASADCLGSLTITDIFFLHERGLIMRYRFSPTTWRYKIRGD